MDVAAFKARTPRPDGLDAAIREEEYLLFIGRLARRKGVDVLLRALAAVPAAVLVSLLAFRPGERYGMWAVDGALLVGGLVAFASL